ncbi:MAG: hypothetical protein MN733_43230 [Nitrososphaera sp.]|nr:hypothetical protein [Nitrososphaera sp.]
MSHWTNLSTHFIGTGSGQASFINFNVPIIGGNQTITLGGIHQYGYALNLFKPSGEPGPTRVAAGLFVTTSGILDFKPTTISKAEIDGGAREMLGNTGEILLLADDTISIGVWADEAEPGLIIVSPLQSTLTLRRVTPLPWPASRSWGVCYLQRDDAVPATKITNLLTELVEVMRVSGPRSTEIKRFIRRHASVPGFVDEALAAILLWEAGTGPDA